MKLYHIAFLSFFVALCVTWIMYPFMLHLARKYNIVDKPNVRKLQRHPVPVFGGAAVWFGVLSGIGFALLFATSRNMPMALAAMTIMLLVGMIDDVKDIPAGVRFVLEVVMVWSIMAISGRYVNDLHGLWGIHKISSFVSMPLSLIAGVGIINAVNLIDGVDGFSSGYGVFACFLFALLFFYSGIATISYLAMSIMGALVPFFLHNVFGKKSKMFIGDSGTLMLGVALVIMIFNILFRDSLCCKWENKGMGLIPFTLAVMAIPVFDTLRVMSMRVLRNRSPFKPDKTHLHHLFIDMKFSHIGTTVTILSLNTLIVLIWFLSWKLGVSIDWQLYLVIIISVLVTFVFYGFMRGQEKKRTRFFIKCCVFGRKTHKTRTGFWNFMMKIMDRGRLYDEKK